MSETMKQGGKSERNQDTKGLNLMLLNFMFLTQCGWIETEEAASKSQHIQLLTSRQNTVHIIKDNHLLYSLLFGALVMRSGGDTTNGCKQMCTP